MRRRRQRPRAEEPDRLSELPDELLQHILHLAPCREAESNAVLSRRWRGLWPRPTGAVKIDLRSPFHGDWLRTTEEALATTHGPVERLAVDVGQGYDYVLGHVLSQPASRGVQDVRIRATASRGLWTDAGNDDADKLSLHDMDVRLLGQFSFFWVPWAALRVLHITNCTEFETTVPLPSTFPCLEVLRLRHCRFTLERLQEMIVASPHVAALQLECVILTMVPTYAAGQKSLCCPRVTNLVLNCDCEPRDHVAIELDVPRVQHFKYKGKINQFTLRSPLPDARRAYLHFISGHRSGNVETCESFWKFLKNFSNTKVLKLKLDWPIDWLAALETRRIMDLLIGGNQSAQSIRFCIEDLEIDAPHNPNSKDVGVAIGNMLLCCPALHDLKLKLNTATKPRRHRRSFRRSLQSKAQMEFQKSIDHFRCRSNRPVVPLHGDDGKFEVSDIPGLSDIWRHFIFLQFNLKKLSLQFHMDKNSPDCIGIRLVKFFIERGKALEEIYIHDGNMKM